MVLGGLWLPGSARVFAQESGARPSVGSLAPHAMRTRRFLAGRGEVGGVSAARAMAAARREHLAMVQAQAELDDAGRDWISPRVLPGVSPRLSPLNAAWAAVGPAQVASQRFGMVTGRVSAVAIDPADASGNTVYLGTTGGGVWKSTNAAGPAASVAFAPLTDTLPVFSANAGGVAIPSLSIGAVSVGDGVVLAGTGDANDATDSYYGEGILRSADGGVTWMLIQLSKDGGAGLHSFVGLGVAGFAWSSATPGLVVAAMAQSVEGVIVNAPDARYGVMGLYYSTDAGVTWQMATIEDGSSILQTPVPEGAAGNAATAVVWNAQRQRFYAAVRFHGYYESVDGVTWTRLAHQPGTGLTLAACPTIGSGAGCPMFRGALAVQAGTGDTFALTVDANNFDQGLWQDVCGGSGGSCAASPIGFGTRLGSGALEVGSGSSAIAQGDYDLSLAAVGAGADTVLFAGTVDLYRCAFGPSAGTGCVLRNTTNAENGCAAPAMVSPAQHAIAVMAGAGTGSAPLAYVGNDGGVWRSVDGVNQLQTPCSPDDATHFQNLNGGLGSLAEVVSFAEHPTDAGTLLVGLGANGTAATSGGASAWPQISAGEGGAVAIDAANPLNWYVSTEAGVSLRYCSHGGSCGAADFAGAPTIGYAQVSNDASVIDPPFLLDPALTSDVLIGTCRVWRGFAQSGAAWPGSSSIGAMFGGPQSGACSGTTNAMVRSLGAGGPASGAGAAQNAGSTVLYAGMAGAFDGGGTAAGHVFANYAAGGAGGSTVWSDVGKSAVTNDAGKFNPGGFDISSVAVDAHDATGKTVYATVMGFAGNGLNAAHVYRSVNGGGSWTNISSNLPNAPANVVLVDPNDANTLYVAMDTGVYVTTTVASCTTANCWSVYGTGLPNAPALALQAAGGMATADGRFGRLRVGTYGRGIWEIPLLSAAPPAAPAMTLNPVSLTFAAQAVGTVSGAKTILVTNSGIAALNVSQVVVTGDFQETDNCVGAASGIAPGASCSVQVTFLPSATGTRMGLLTVYGNVAGGQATAALTGVGTTGAAIALSPLSVTYSATGVGATSAAQDITISNTGGSGAALGTPVVTGDFAITANTCGATLASNTGCTVSVVFKPTASGARTGSFSITDSVGTQTSSLSGTAVSAATDGLAPLSLTFGVQPLNTLSATQMVTLTNTGDAALTGISGVIASGDFTVVNSCGNSLNGHSTCSMLVAFVPKSVGAGAGVLTVSDVLRSQTVILNGTGVAPVGVLLSPVGPVSFAATGVGLTTAAQTVTLTNNGGLPLSITSFGVTGDFVIVAGTNTCGATLAAGSACVAQVVFAPTAAGTRVGSLTVVDSAAGSPQSLQLMGAGVDFSLAANGPTTATVSAGTQAVYGLLLSSAAGVPGTVTFACSGVPAHATCTVNPKTAGLGGTTTVTVTVATSVAGAAVRSPWERQVVWVAGLFPFWLLFVRRRGLRVAAMLVCVLLVAGCASSRVIPGSDTGSPGGGGSGGGAASPTPAGTYNLVVSGSSAGLIRSVGLTVVVQ